MKIGFFTDGFLPQPNGVATSVFSSARQLEKRGHEVYIVAPKYPGYKDEMNVFRLTSVKVMSKPELRLALHLPDKPLRRLLKMDFDIIHVHSGGPITLLGWEIAKAKNIPIVATYHTLWNKYTHYFLKGKVIRPKMIEQATRIFCNRCDYLIAPTTHVENELKRYGIQRPITVIPNGVDLENFNNAKKNVLRKKYSIPEDHSILLSVARMGEEKSINFLIRSFAKVLKENPKTTLVLVGDGPEKKSLTALSKSLGIKENTIFTGYMDPRELPEVYADADLFLFSSETETQGMVILEALASGVPVIAVSAEAFEGVIENGINGFLLSKEEDQFAQKIEELLKDDGQRKKLSEGAKSSSARHSIESSTEDVETLYKKVLEAHGKGGMERIMSSNLSYEQLYVTLLSFWVTVLLVRFYTFLFHASSYPAFFVFSFSFPHILVGLILFLFLVPFVVKRKELHIVVLLLLGSSLALSLDDFWIFATGSAHEYVDYWARGNLVFLVLAGVLPVLFARYVKKNKPEFFIEAPTIQHANPENPKVSVVVPSYNEEHFIKRTLASLVNQTYKDFELVVVDNNSTDRTGEIAKEFGARVIVEHKKGVAFARQAGFEVARGEIIVTTDADTVVPEDWIEKMVAGFSSDKVVGFGGLNRLYSGPVDARASARYLATLFWVVDKIASNGWNLLGSNLAVRKSAFEKIGGFNTKLTLGEDVDLSQRLKKIGEVKLNPNFLVFSSGRRFRSGLFLGVITYAPSWFMRVLFKKDKFLSFPTIRDEYSIIGKFSLLPLVFGVVFLVILFYIANPAIFTAQPFRFIEKIVLGLQQYYK